MFKPRGLAGPVYAACRDENTAQVRIPRGEEWAPHLELGAARGENDGAMVGDDAG